MIKKPEKKKEIKLWEDCTSTGNADDAYDHGYERGSVDGYNNACDDWEKYHNWRMSQLPKEEEIRNIIAEHLKWNLYRSNLYVCIHTVKWDLLVLSIFYSYDKSYYHLIDYPLLFLTNA